jgi:hypothetical protein
MMESSPGGSLDVICSGEIQRLCDITGLTESFELYPNLASAVARHPTVARKKVLPEG